MGPRSFVARDVAEWRRQALARARQCVHAARRAACAQRGNVKTMRVRPAPRIGAENANAVEVLASITAQ